jgi:hypothetical protein
VVEGGVGCHFLTDQPKLLRGEIQLAVHAWEPTEWLYDVLLILRASKPSSCPPFSFWECVVEEIPHFVFPCCCHLHSHWPDKVEMVSWRTWDMVSWCVICISKQIEERKSELIFHQKLIRLCKNSTF